MAARAARRPAGATRLAKSLFIAVCALVLVGCATAPVSAPERVSTGRFSAVATQAEKRDSVSGRFTVEVRGDRQTIALASPLGTTVAQIEVGPDGARASGPGLQEVRGPDADALTEQLLGWRLPVNGLPDWIEGRPAPSRPARIERAGNRPVLIEQDGWVVRLSDTFPGTEAPPPDRARAPGFADCSPV